MGSSNPYNSQNFVGLLSSQNDSETHLSFSPPIQTSSSQIPQYSTQYSDAQNLAENSRASRRRWTSQCKQRWKKINEGVNKFVGCYSLAERQRSSGQSEGDVLKMAHEFYANTRQAKFTLEHAWLELRHDQKWSTSKWNERSKRTKLDGGGTYSSSSNPTSKLDEEEVDRRPPGVKASKAKAKKSGTSLQSEGTSSVDFDRLWEIKARDIAGRERINKQRLLDNLLSKTELSELEVNLKNKLIADMLG